MEIKQLTIQGFKSFDNAQTIDFTKMESGFYFITGENKVEPRLGANGVGKSSIWDALCWVLYGKVSTSARASTYKNWHGKKPCKVILDFNHHGQDYHLERTWSPNTLKLATNPITQEELTAIIGLDFSAFLYTIFVSQFSSKFFDLSPADKLGIFSEVLDLDKWKGYSNTAKDKASNLNAGIISEEKNLARVEGHLDSAKESDYTDDLKNWESGQEKKSEELCLEAERIGLEISKKSGTLAGVEKLIPEAQADLDKVNIKIDDADARVKNLNKKGAEYRDLQVEASTKLKLVEKELTKFEDVEKNCPYCLQEVSESYLANTTEGLFAKQAKLAQKKAEYIEKESDIAEKIDAVDKETPASSANPFINKLSDLNNEKRILDRDIDRMTDDFHVVEQNLEKLHDEKNPYATLQEIRDDKVKTLSAQQEEIAANITAMNKDYELNKYWIKGFKEVRLFVLSEVLQEFEIQVNNALQKLGLPDWTIKLAVDSETKSGTVRKGFSVLVKSPMNDDLVPFECWSGGEGQRLKLAGTLGLMDLIASRAGADWNIEIFDEPTAWLSEEGINDLLDVLKDRSKSTGREIFVIDHRNFNTFGGFDGSINVTKDASGTSLEVEVFGEKT